MQFKTDENLLREVAQLLRQHGHDALSVNDQDMAGETDMRLSEICRAEGRALVTLDTDFADIRTYPPSACAGLVVLRLQRQDKEHVLGVVEKLIPILSAEELSERLWIVDERQVRIRQ